jgi:two-component system, NtrC family, nitrogen regulation response regulator GlnG
MPSRKNQYPGPERRYPNEGGAPPLGSEPPSVSTLEAPPSLKTAIQRLAPSKVTVLLVGGSSAGRHAVALALHQHSPRVERPFVVFDCTGLSASKVEAELFGGPMHLVQASGAIQLAGAGTIYLASIDELPLLVQPRLLRFLDDERAARVVASTAKDLWDRVHDGEFRLDLAERLTLVELILTADGR